MQMKGEQRIAATRQRVWEALNDPEILRQCVPGCQSLEKEAEDRFKAIVEIKIGPIGARFNGGVQLSELDPPSGYTITGEGQAGTVGFAKGGAKVRLTDDGGATLLSYDVESQVGGRLAQLGGPIIDATAKRLAAQFFKKFSAIVEGTDSAPAVVSTAAVQPSASPGTASPRTASPAPPSPHGVPIAWILALVVAALTGFLIGRGQDGAAGSDWMGLAIGLLVVIVAATGFEFGRRNAAPTVILDADALARLLGGAGK